MFTEGINCRSSTALHVPGCGIIALFEFMWALREAPEGGRRAFQHMASRAMLVICSDSQVQSLFIQLAPLSNSDPQFGMHVWL